MKQHLRNAGWIAAFIVLSVVWGREVMIAARHVRPQQDTGVWICPILGRCGPPGTPGLGRW
jgi:hypothetical protein